MGSARLGTRWPRREGPCARDPGRRRGSFLGRSSPSPEGAALGLGRVRLCQGLEALGRPRPPPDSRTARTAASRRTAPPPTPTRSARASWVRVGTSGPQVGRRPGSRRSRRRGQADPPPAGASARPRRAPTPSPGRRRPLPPAPGSRSPGAQAPPHACPGPARPHARPQPRPDLARPADPRAAPRGQAGLCSLVKRRALPPRADDPRSPPQPTARRPPPGALGRLLPGPREGRRPAGRAPPPRGGARHRRPPPAPCPPSSHK